MLQEFLDYIKQEELLNEKDHVLLAVSGGIDSVVMAHLFKKSGFYFSLAHCNFSLRGKESDEDEIFVRELANQLDVKCYCRRFDTAQFARNSGQSTQMAARALRYDWFQVLTREEKIDWIATAHHQNDVLETVLFNLVKGTGIAGLRGIKPKHHNIIRPMLFAQRTSIEEYASQNKLEWREDSSNQSNKYHRNLIRNSIVPILRKINPDLESTLTSTMDKLLEVEKIFLRKVEEVKLHVCEQKDDHHFIDKSEIAKIEGGKIILYELIKPFSFNYSQLNDIYQNCLSGVVGKLYESHDFVLNVDRENLIIIPKSDHTISTFIEEDQDTFDHTWCTLHFEKIERESLQMPTSKRVACLDFEKLNFPLKLRNWKEGDWFYPLGMNHKKKLSDFMIDEKIPLTLKERVLVLTSGSSIVWVVGHRIDHRFRITDNTRMIYKIINRGPDDKSI
ncbi:tRNA lysidine(34) synthetase TilS [Fulvivirgaceae bacterium BMA10]|uniref:tRNA(Ile)-lysidine synthase n=1 Tax=Splendidivirga corallicola TaxID=3051826 RepID=A0ABT8KJP1_9BACT|nr:tRNA lysidine(34) synthetase TilS [Fulvivirgaceae bacterium BMA10]